MLGIVGRNGMGKTTLCNAICGLVPARGSVRLAGEEILGLPPHQITPARHRLCAAGAPLLPSLSVEETLRLVARQRRDIERVYAMFPRLAERKGHGGAQLSGGEQQMLAIGRALLLSPRLLVMDEPTEGLAPVIVEQVAQALGELSGEDEIAVLLIEQNLGVAIDVADRIGVMVNGRIAQELPAAELGANRELQERLLGIRSAGDDEEEALPTPADAEPAPTQVFTVRRAHGDGALRSTTWSRRTCSRLQSLERRWDRAPVPPSRGSQPIPPRGERVVRRTGVRLSSPRASGASLRRGTFDTKGLPELYFLRQCLERLGLRVVTVDLSTSASRRPRRCIRRGRASPPGRRVGGVSGDRAAPSHAMALAFSRFSATAATFGGLLSAGGSGGTTLATAGMRELPVGRAQGDGPTMPAGHPAYVGPSDICMMYSGPTCRDSSHQRAGAANAAHALAGMIAHPPAISADNKPALGLTMFGVYTPCVQAVVKRIAPTYDCLFFHATASRAVDGEARRLGPATPARSRLHDGDRRRDRRRRALGRADPARRVRPATRCPTSARAARSTWELGAWRRCPSASAAAGSIATTRR